jgi:hypothetical protein
VRRYPLAVLLGIRLREEAAARQALSAALAAARQAAGAREAAWAALREEGAPSAPVAPGAGAGESAAELQRGAAFQARRRSRVGLLRERVQASDEALAVADGLVRARREDLEQARSATRAIDEHRARWVEQALRRRSEREQAGADDLVSARAGAS